ncbi:MAG: CoA ester lyase [Bradyrhizobium sp.]|nr:MAG: CoA ester lyase [Bradyrhizobium sp.]
MTLRPRRSVLYVPAANPSALAKARDLAADAIVIDLEDSVAPDQKPAARASAVEAIRAGGFGRREIVLRVNGLHTPWGKEDFEAAVAAAPDAILTPKLEGPDDVMAVAQALRAAGAPERIRLWAMIETPKAVLSAGAIAACAADPDTRLEALVMGLNDLASATRARLTPGRPAALAWLGFCVAAARAHGCDIVDGVYNDFNDAIGFRAECEQGRDFGFDGKTLIHPGQIEICNEVFAPAEAEIATARAILTAFARPENAGKGVIQLEGKMVERLHADMAGRTLALAEGIAALER